MELSKTITFAFLNIYGHALFLVILSQHLTTAMAIDSGSHSLGNQTDRFALLSIKSQLVDHSEGLLSSWNDSIDHCNWEGVSCERGKNRVNALDLSSRGLQGTISPFIGNLTFLVRIWLFNNSLKGEIPNELGHLVKLMDLKLDNNTLGGEIPKNISACTSLETLSVGVNNLRGNLPLELTALLKLKHLIILKNFLTGPLFDVITNLTSLRTVSSSCNAFTGTIPDGISNLINLEYLDLGNSEFTGTIPSEFGKLRKLDTLILSFNKLTGIIPHSFGNITFLSSLYLEGNELQGNIPSSLSACKYMLAVYLCSNHLTGTLPVELFTGPAKLISLNFSANHLEGSIPSEISSQLNLLDFDVSGNKLTGVLPSELSECTSLQILKLEGNLFHGTIPPSFSSLRSLTSFDVSQNNLSGTIPIYFSGFPLVYLNLADNNFEGNVPTVGVYADVSVVSLSGNSRICGGTLALHLPKCILQKERRTSSALKLTISIICAFIGVVIMIVWLYLTCLRKKRRSFSSGSMRETTLFRISYSMLLKMTDGFSRKNMLGTGSFGSVFRGVLEGKMFAIKIFNLQHQSGSKSFLVECQALKNIRHRNLLGIITACSSFDYKGNEFKALVYEFMPNGSLDRWLYGAGNLSLLRRVNVAIDVAHAINYLHHHCEIPIVHCDLKPSNILLDYDFVAHVGDFGIAKFLAQPQNPHLGSVAGVGGTIGYSPPEYGPGSEATTDGDLYSYGVLLLELMTGKKPTDYIFMEDLDLHSYADATLPDQVLQIVDPTLLENDKIIEDHEQNERIKTVMQLECIISVVHVGVACSNHLPQDRMRIAEALSKLLAARDTLTSVPHRGKFERGE